MPYKNKPFNYFGASPYQVRIDLEAANLNFDILANAFVNNTPDAGIVKQADMLDGFHASQIPRPNTIPASYDTGKIDVGWIPDDWYDLIFPYFFNHLHSDIIVVADDNGIATVNATFEEGKPLSISFRKTKKLVLNIPFDIHLSFDPVNPRTLVLEIKGFLSPTLNVPQYVWDSDIRLLPNNTVYNLFPGFLLGRVSAITDVHFEWYIFFSREKRRTYSCFFNMYGGYVWGDDVSDRYKIVLPQQPPIVYNYSASFYTDLWSLNSIWVYGDGGVSSIPWTTLGTIDFVDNTYDGYINITGYLIDGG